ncbi:uncharacterized protein LOC118201495, partial [Stegodyphus dumicola]|uniref:uncharacterized protein LOC118201495 n=1 Tax=Stegodyphus dumicola TaxID=202533 RepID=UPI0015AE2F48
MRLTNILYQVNYHRHFQRIWKRQGKLQVLDVVIPPELEKMGVEIKDAKDFFLETQRYIAPKEKKLGPKFTPPSVLSQNKYLYLMHEKTKVSENENQTLALTKTVPYQGLPKELTSLIGIDVLPNQDELVKTSLLQAQVWDAIQHKLPKKLDISRPQFIFRREFGIRYKRKVLHTKVSPGKISPIVDPKQPLVIKATSSAKATIFELIWPWIGNDVVEADIPEICTHARPLRTSSDLITHNFSVVVKNHTFSVSELFSLGGDEIIYRMPCDILLTSEEPLKPFASAEQVAATEKEVVPNIYPIKPTLDLDKYTESPFTLQPTVSLGNENVHTLFIAQKSIGFWFPKQLLARAIATCFAFTASEAQRKYGALKADPPLVDFDQQERNFESLCELSVDLFNGVTLWIIPRASYIFNAELLQKFHCQSADKRGPLICLDDFYKTHVSEDLLKLHTDITFNFKKIKELESDTIYQVHHLAFTELESDTTYQVHHLAFTELESDTTYQVHHLAFTELESDITYQVHHLAFTK